VAVFGSSLVAKEGGMILPLRRRHRVVVIFLAVFLTIAFAYAIVTRRPAPMMRDLQVFPGVAK
jgi:hypothetical protein